MQDLITKNSQIDIDWLKTEAKDIKDSLVYFEGLLEREAYQPEADRGLTRDIINNLKKNLLTVQEEYARKLQNKESK